MTVPWSIAQEYELHLYPPGLFMVGTKFFDVLVETFFGLRQSTWRSYLPFGLGSGKWSWYSIEYAIPDAQPDLQHLETYPEFYHRVCNGSGGSSASDASSNGFSAPQCWYKFAFETNTTELSDLTRLRTFMVVLLLAGIVHVIKNKMCRPYFSSIGRGFARKHLGEEWVNNNEEKIFKFGEYVFRFTFHSILSIYSVYYFYDKPWWDVYNSNGGGGTVNLWTNYGSEPIEVGMIWYYIILCAYNLEAMLLVCYISFKITIFNKKYFPMPWSVISIEWSPTVRGDFPEMFTHHVATNALIVLSSQLMFHRIGSMILVLHDISDIPVDMSKLANFTKSKRGTAICLVIMIVTWIVTRLVVLPGVALYSIIYESHLMGASRIKLGTSIYADTQLHLSYKAYQCLFVWLIGFLILLHLFWLYIILKIAYVAITKNEIHDYAEHRNGEANATIRRKEHKKLL